MYRRMLVAIDGSAAAARALDEAIQLAVEAKASLGLIHVVDMPYVYDGENVDFNALAVQRAAPGQTIISEATAKVRQAGIEPEVMLGSSEGGRVGTAIVAEAKRWTADLIVLGTHGHNILRRLLGSTAEDVVRGSPVPILLVRGQ